MLNEPASMYDDLISTPRTTAPDPDEHDLAGFELEQIVARFMTIATTEIEAVEKLTSEDLAILAQNRSQLAVSFTGTLLDDAEYVYQGLDDALRSRDMYPLLRLNQADPANPHLIHIVSQRAQKPRPFPIYPNIVLFVLTIFSVLFTGTTIAIGEIGLDDPLRAAQISSSLTNIMQELWRGAPYALSILLILVPHEMAHYLMMRRHKAHATLPYFIPAFLISPFGTFGAAIMLRESLKNRRTLLDVGASGPIVGFLIAVPIVLIGLATSRVIPITPGGLVEGNSLIYALAKIAVFGRMLPDGNVDVIVNQLAWAGWTGLFVTALNLIPLGQLDGGHVLYALFGDRARVVYFPLLGAMLLLALFLSSTWALFLLLLFFVGRFYAVPLDNITPLDPRRRLVAIFALLIFVVSFTPIPIYQQGTASGLLGGIEMTELGTMAVIALIVVPRWWRFRQIQLQALKPDGRG